MKILTIGTLMMLALMGIEAQAADQAMTADETACTSSGQDDADRAPHKKVIIKKGKKGKKKVVVSKRRRGRRVVVAGGPRHVVAPAVVHRRRVVVHSGPPVVETVHHVPARRRAVTHRQYRRRPVEDRMLGIGLRISGVTVDGEKLNLATMENPTMGGLGLQFRGKLSRRVGLEFAADVLYGETNDMAQTTVPVTLSALYYFFPESTVRLYGLLGAGVHLTKLEYERGFRHDLVEIAGQAGGGLELRLSPEFSLNADLRFIGLYKNIDQEASLQSDCLKYTGMTCSGINDTGKFNAGAQFMVGANLFF